MTNKIEVLSEEIMNITEGMLLLIKLIDKITGGDKKKPGTIMIEETVNELGNKGILIEFIPKEKK